jgi:hypothetical protein
LLQVKILQHIDMQLLSTQNIMLTLANQTSIGELIYSHLEQINQVITARTSTCNTNAISWKLFALYDVIVTPKSESGKRIKINETRESNGINSPANTIILYAHYDQLLNLMAPERLIVIKTHELINETEFKGNQTMLDTMFRYCCDHSNELLCRWIGLYQYEKDYSFIRQIILTSLNEVTNLNTEWLTNIIMIYLFDMSVLPTAHNSLQSQMQLTGPPPLKKRAFFL